MISISHPEDGDEQMIQSNTDPWIKHLNTLWDIRFEQHESPTEDKVTQVNLGDESIWLSYYNKSNANHLSNMYQFLWDHISFYLS